MWVFLNCEILRYRFRLVRWLYLNTSQCYVYLLFGSLFRAYIALFSVSNIASVAYSLKHKLHTEIFGERVKLRVQITQVFIVPWIHIFLR